MRLSPSSLLKGHLWLGSECNTVHTPPQQYSQVMGFVHHMLFYALYLALTEFLNTLKEAQLYRNETCQEKHFSLRKMCRFAIQVV